MDQNNLMHASNWKEVQICLVAATFMKYTQLQMMSLWLQINK